MCDRRQRVEELCGAIEAFQDLGSAAPANWKIGWKVHEGAIGPEHAETDTREPLRDSGVAWPLQGVHADAAGMIRTLRENVNSALHGSNLQFGSITVCWPPNGEPFILATFRLLLHEQGTACNAFYGVFDDKQVA